MLDLADPSLEGPLGRVAMLAPISRRSSARFCQLKGEEATASLADVHEGKLHRRTRATVDCDEGRQCRRSRRRGHLSLLLVRRSGEDRREQQERRACITSRTRIRAPSSAYPAAACLQSTPAQGRNAQAFLRFVAGKAGQDILRDGTSYRVRRRQWRSQRKRLVPALSDLDAPKVEASDARQRRKSSDLMTAAGLL